MGPGSSQGAWLEEINGHNNWREVQATSKEKLIHHEGNQVSVAQRSCAVSVLGGVET